MSPERLVSRVLSLGGLVSLTVLVVGLVIYVAAAGTGQETNDLYRSLTHAQAGRPAAVYSTLTEIAHGVRREPPDPLAIIALGLVLLVATPVASLVAAMVAFARAGDRDYAVIAAIVLCILLVSFTLSGGVG
jgi:uncharacterized membrane protein